MRSSLLVAVALAVASAEVVAQNCPQGIPSAGNPFCIPPSDPRSIGGSVNIQKMVWEDRWGAIAFDPQKGFYGASENNRSKRDAEDGAIQSCRRNGGTVHCRTELVFHNQCGVVAWGNEYVTTASAPTIKGASERAIYTCSEKSSGCEIVYASCSMAELVK